MKRLVQLAGLLSILCGTGMGIATERAATVGRPGEGRAARPNIILILADDLGFSDLGSYGSRIETPNLDRLAKDGLRFTQFYNAARCCPTRAALLTGQYPHEAGVGHMMQDWTQYGAAYSSGLNEQCATLAELLNESGYRSYLSGKWHVGGSLKGQERNYPTSRGFAHWYGMFGGGDFFAPDNLYQDRERIRPTGDYYFTDAVTEHALAYLDEHRQAHSEEPFFLHLTYTAPHFPLQARPAEIARYRGRYLEGWDVERVQRIARLRQLGILTPQTRLSPRDPVAQSWESVTNKDEWELRMAVHSAMVDRMDQGIGRVLERVRQLGVEENTLVLFLSDNGASAEALDSWPDPRRGHRPGTETGRPESHHCLEIGWANAANTPFRENKMWIHEGGIATPLIAYWPGGLQAKGALTRQVGHVVDLMPTFLELAGGRYPATYRGHRLKPLAGRSLVPVLRGQEIGARTLAWEHEGNRGIRVGDWKLVAVFRGAWELYDLAVDRTETNNLAPKRPAKVRELAARWQDWADRVGVVPWEKLPGANYQPGRGYAKKSEFNHR
jgi:arylsulfatase A-like enzyme